MQVHFINWRYDTAARPIDYSEVAAWIYDLREGYPHDSYRGDTIVPNEHIGAEHYTLDLETEVLLSARRDGEHGRFVRPTILVSLCTDANTSLQRPTSSTSLNRSPFVRSCNR